MDFFEIIAIFSYGANVAFRRDWLAYGFSKFHKHWVKPQPQIMGNLFPQAFFGVIRFAGITKPDSV